MVLSSAIVCDHDRRIADDRRSSFHMIADDRRPYRDLRSAICDPRSYGNQPLDRTWFYLLRSRSQDRRRSQTLLRSAICDPRSYGNQPLISVQKETKRSSPPLLSVAISRCSLAEKNDKKPPKCKMQAQRVILL